MNREFTIHLHAPHAKQEAFIRSKAKRKSIRAGRRSGKTDGMAILAVEQFLAGRRVLYATPTQDQIQAFWFEVSNALAEPIEAGIFAKNETMHTIELPGTKQRIRAKTAWNANTLRGDYADLLILDEWQLMAEEAWDLVGAPMLLDNNGDAVFIYTPPSIASRAMSKAIDPMHAAKRFKLYQERQEAGDSRYAVFHFTSHDNPYISAEALKELTGDMTALSIRMEIDAEDIDELPGALWKRAVIDTYRVATAPDLARIVVAVDPAASSSDDSDETGIVVAGVSADRQAYVLDDYTLRGSPAAWARAAITAYRDYEADCIVYEKNQGGEMVLHTLESVVEPGEMPPAMRDVWASRGKVPRAQPVSGLYEKGRVHHVGSFPALEDQLCSWLPGDDSPDRLDALVWAITYLIPEYRPSGGIHILK